MKTSEAGTGRCPVCHGRVTQDRKRRGFVRHLTRTPNGVKCAYGLKQKD